jgi:hypothetical protein
VSEGRSTPGAPVSAVSHDYAQPTGQKFHLFITDPNGGIYTIIGDPQAGFELWQNVSPRDPLSCANFSQLFRAAPGSPVTVVQFFTLFVADMNGRIALTSGRGADWLCWFQLGQVSARPRSPITAVRWGNGFALFVTDASGGVYTSSVPDLFPVSNYEQVPWSGLPLVSAVPGSPITAVAIGESHIALFVTDANGTILTTSSF